MISIKHPVVLFDGVCNLCDGLVQFLIKIDHNGKLRFTSLQSDTGQALLEEYQLPTQDFDSFIFINNNKYYRQSDAAIEICSLLGGFYKVGLIFYVIPRVIRNALYSWIAANRYKWFGKKNACMIPTPELKKRFLD